MLSNSRWSGPCVEICQQQKKKLKIKNFKISLKTRTNLEDNIIYSNTGPTNTAMSLDKDVKADLLICSVPFMLITVYKLGLQCHLYVTTGQTAKCHLELFRHFQTHTGMNEP